MEKKKTIRDKHSNVSFSYGSLKVEFNLCGETECICGTIELNGWLTRKLLEYKFFVSDSNWDSNQKFQTINAIITWHNVCDMIHLRCSIKVILLSVALRPTTITGLSDFYSLVVQTMCDNVRDDLLKLIFMVQILLRLMTLNRYQIAGLLC